MSQKLIFGLDLGLNNIGHSAVKVLSDDKIDIEHLGTYIFASPLVDDNDPKAGYSAGQRGAQRRARRTIQRRSLRKRALYHILSEHRFLPRDRKARILLLCRNYNDARPFNPYVLRAKAISEAITPYELGRVLTHLANHRGFLSPRAQRLIGIADDLLVAASDSSEETGKLLSEIRATREAIKQTGAPTVGAFYAERLKNNLMIRSKTRSNRKLGGVKVPSELRKEFKGKDLTSKHVRPDRQMIKEEFKKIIAVQQKYHPLLTASLAEKIQNTIFSQRPIEGDSDKRGACTFFPNEKRIYRASLAAQKFIIAQNIANLEVTEADGNSRKLLASERVALANVLLQGEDLDWKAAKALINVGPDATFNREPVGKSRGKLSALKGSATARAIKEVLKNQWDDLDHEARYELVGDLISYAKSSGSHAERRYHLLQRKAYGPNQVRLSQQTAAELATLELPKGTLNVSLKAARMLIPFMLRDMTYDQAAAAKGLNHAQPSGPAEKVKRLDPKLAQHILHPGVRCSVQNAFRVINAMLDKYGTPDAIHIELPRDLALSLPERAELERQNFEREKVRKVARQRLVEVGLPPTKANVDKILLFDECEGKLPYEPGRNIASLHELCSADIEVDHIVPRSHQITDAKSNFVLCTADCNRQKGGRTPYEAWGHDADRWASITAHVNSIKSMPLHKRQRILAKTRPEGFLGRHLAATGYISREILTALKTLEGEIDVVVSPGKATGMLRGRWGLGRLIELHPEEQAKLDAYESGDQLNEPPKFRSNYKHHALDALVIALTTRSMLLRVTKYFKYREETRLREIDFPTPDRGLIAKAKVALEQCQIVHKPNRKLEGQIHELTARTPDPSIPPGKPFSAVRFGKQLVRFDADGKPAQAYDLGNNHHVAIFKRTDGSGKYAAEVRSLYEVYERRAQRLPAVSQECSQPGYRFLFSLCKGDMVRMADGRLGVVSKFSAKAKWGDAAIVIWHPYVAQQAGKVNAENPYLISHIQTAGGLAQIKDRVIISPLAMEK